MGHSDQTTPHDTTLRMAAALLIAGTSCLATAETPLPTKSKLAASWAAAPPAGRSAPFVAFRGPLWADAPQALMSLSPARESAIPGSCARDAETLCYDYRQGRIVYQPARKLMPEIGGLRRESLTLKRDRVTLNYSFK
jgi:hypothetical protein